MTSRKEDYTFLNLQIKYVIQYLLSKTGENEAWFEIAKKNQFMHIVNLLKNRLALNYDQSLGMIG